LRSAVSTMTDPRDSSRRPARNKALSSAAGPGAKGRVSSSEIDVFALREPRGLRRLVCAGFCTFYRPVADTRDHCGGLGELERLVEGALGSPHVVARWTETLSGVLESDAPVSFRWDVELEMLICRACPFLPDGGCDHRNPEIPPDERLEPCGGYVLLAALADRGLIALE
jgi:hypothetical protein